MDDGRAGVAIEEANLPIGSCAELIENLLIFVHSNKTGLRERVCWGNACKVGGLGSLWREKQRGYFFHQENKNTNNAQDDSDPAHGNDDLSKPINDATPRDIG